MPSKWNSRTPLKHILLCSPLSIHPLLHVFEGVKTCHTAPTRGFAHNDECVAVPGPKFSLSMNIFKTRKKRLQPNIQQGVQ